MRHNMKKLEVFTGSCRLCEAAVQLATDTADPAKYEILVKSIDGDDAKAYGLTAVPSIVLDGKTLFQHLPTKEQLEAVLS